jgi:hypothetical protein
MPLEKSDLERARAVVALGYPEVAPILPALLQWLQDINWPVASVLAPFLASIGPKLAPHVRQVLQTDDEVWKYHVIQSVVAQSSELCQALTPQLQRIARNPTPTEQQEEVNLVALDALEKASERDA